jgi:hypothetical protein
MNEQAAGLPWGEMPYDGKTPREVIDDYVLIRGDLEAEYARAQLASWIDRYAAARLASESRELAEARERLAACERLADQWHHPDHGDACWGCAVQRALRSTP